MRPVGGFSDALRVAVYVVGIGVVFVYSSGIDVWLVGRGSILSNTDRSAIQGAASLWILYVN